MATGQRRRGFTLMELALVIALMGLLAVTALPSILVVSRAGAEAQAYNEMSAALTAARAMAVESASYVVVHVQPAVRQRYVGGAWKWQDSDNEWYRMPAGLTYVTVFVYNDIQQKFVLATGFRPQPIAGQFVFGEVNDRFVSGKEFREENDPRNKKFNPVENIDDFTSFNVIFSPSGLVVKKIPGMGNLVAALAAGEAFTNGKGGENTSSLYSYSGDANSLPDEEGVSAITLFDQAAMDRIKDPIPAMEVKKKRDYLNENGQIIWMNVYTGKLFKRK